MKRYIAIIAINILILTSINAQEKSKDNFVFMTGYGYSYGEFASGITNINSFAYKTHRNWAVGLDLTSTIGGRKTTSLNTGNYLKSTHEVACFSVGPNIYYFIVDNSKHQFYANAGVSYVYKRVYNLQVEYRSKPDNPVGFDYDFYGKDWGRHGGMHAFGMNLSTGYSYKLSQVFGIGTRFYFNMMEDWFVAGLVNLTMTF